jgi:hypothetical protein
MSPNLGVFVLPQTTWALCRGNHHLTVRSLTILIFFLIVIKPAATHHQLEKEKRLVPSPTLARLENIL